MHFSKWLPCYQNRTWYQTQCHPSCTWDKFGHRPSIILIRSQQKVHEKIVQRNKKLRFKLWEKKTKKMPKNVPIFFDCQNFWIDQRCSHQKWESLADRFFNLKKSESSLDQFFNLKKSESTIDRFFNIHKLERSVDQFFNLRKSSETFPGIDKILNLLCCVIIWGEINVVWFYFFVYTWGSAVLVVCVYVCICTHVCMLVYMWVDGNNKFN